MGFKDRLVHGWNAFASSANNDISPWNTQSFGERVGVRPDRNRLRIGNDKSMIASIYNQIAIDFAAVDIQHVKLDNNQNGRYLSTVNSGLNNCLSLSANTDEAARAFKQNIAMTLFEKGTIALVPVDTDYDPDMTGGWDVMTMRVGEIIAWHPKHIRVSVYNEATGRKEELTLSKDFVAIVENPLYSVMNEPNSTLQRLVRKLSLLDSIDEQTGSGKLDLIIQLPYVIKSEARRQQAEQRRSDIETQLQGSKYGIAYTDGTERVTQLNRPAENNMLKQIEYLTGLLYSQLGLTEDVFRGTANEKTMLNYYNRTVEPLLTAVSQAMERTFLTKTARTLGHAIRFYRDPFKLVSIGDVADLADKLLRNKIMTPNEFRSVLALKPSTDTTADQLMNPNMPASADPSQQAPPPVDPSIQPPVQA